MQTRTSTIIMRCNDIDVKSKPPNCTCACSSFIYNSAGHATFNNSSPTRCITQSTRNYGFCQWFSNVKEKTLILVPNGLWLWYLWSKHWRIIEQSRNIDLKRFTFVKPPLEVCCFICRSVHISFLYVNYNDNIAYLIKELCIDNSLDNTTSCTEGD